MKKTLEIPVVVLKTKTGYSAHSPAVDGCVASRKTIDGTLNALRDALEFHLEGEQLVKNQGRKPSSILKKAFEDYGTEAFYATIEVAS